jgi:TRAP-type C4-dicarboxylate transport system permease small subunit
MLILAFYDNTPMPTSDAVFIWALIAGMLVFVFLVIYILIRLIKRFGGKKSKRS